jgi:tetratricopeptide (TPR) repeat protein
MSQTPAARSGCARCRRHLSTGRRVATLAALAVAILAGCATRRAAMPLDTPGESPAMAEPAPDSAEDDAAMPLYEEPLLDHDTALAPSDPTIESSALPIAPPPLLETIDASTAPHVAAATRLVDHARERMIAGDSGGALEQLERAIAIDSGNPYAYYYLAQLHLMHRTYDQAIAFADRAASLSGARTPAWASRAYSLQGNAFEAAGRFADARNAYQRALQVAPGNLAARVGLARVGGPAVP